MSFVSPYIKTGVTYDMAAPDGADEGDAAAKMDFPEQSDHEQSVDAKKQGDKHKECLQRREGEVTGTNDNPRKLFLLSLLPEINDMTENQMRLFRRKVLRLIDEISSVSDTIE
jgi:hypothetical protein